ncbi:MAG: NTP transferase domain-containing protein [Candidatus Hodarchaeota archaeon]
MINCMVLAAGESTRFPGNKLLFEIKSNVTILDNLITSILNSKVDRTTIVTGFEASKIRPRIQALNDGSISVVFNPNFKQGGMSSSIRKGLKEILADSTLKTDAVIITPADIPFIPSKVFDQLIDRFQSNLPKIIIPTFQKKKGHPILISSALFLQITGISEERRGLKEIIQRFRDEIIFLETDAPGILQDIDTYDDIRMLNSNINK